MAKKFLLKSSSALALFLLLACEESPQQKQLNARYMLPDITPKATFNRGNAPDVEDSSGTLQFIANIDGLGFEPILTITNKGEIIVGKQAKVDKLAKEFIAIVRKEWPALNATYCEHTFKKGK